MVKNNMVHELFKGVWINFYDYRSYKKLNEVVNSKNIFRIDHCVKGILEGECKDGCCKYISENEFSLRLTQSDLKKIKFPFNEYYGLSIIIDLDGICEEFAGMLSMLTIDIKNICKKLNLEEACYTSKVQSRINTIFDDMYRLDEHKEITYLKIKLIELLHLCLKISPKDEDRMIYYKGKYVNTVKKIRNRIINNIEESLVLEKVIQEYNISMNVFRDIFKKIYGENPYTYFKNYKIKYAALMITETDKNINEIAISIGYENASKFSQAFKKVMGRNPLEYRKENIFCSIE